MIWRAKVSVVASVQYRTSNEAVFPAQLEDVKAAIRYLKAHSERYGIDPERFGVMGESAGGHLTAMTALTGDHKEFDKGEYLEYSSAVQAACPWYLPADISKMPRLSDVEMMAAPESLMLGKNAALHEEEAMKACPISYVTKDAPPFLLLHGTNDHTVPYTQGEAMYEALTEAGADADLIAIEGADHADLHFFQREVWKIIADLFKEKAQRKVKFAPFSVALLPPDPHAEGSRLCAVAAVCPVEGQLCLGNLEGDGLCLTWSKSDRVKPFSSRTGRTVLAATS